MREYDSKYNKQQRKGKENAVLYRLARGLKEAQEDEKGFTLIELLVVITLQFHKRLRWAGLLPN